MANPIEPPPFSVRYKRPMTMPGVLGGGSGPNGPVGALPQRPESYLRYDDDLTDDHGMREYRQPEPSRGTFSMMTAPENVNAVTGASQLEDLGLAEELARRRMAVLASQPYTGQQLPYTRTVGQEMERRASQESAQDTLARLDAMFGNIESERDRFMRDRMSQGMSAQDAKYDADEYAMRMERRAMAAAQLAGGRALPSGAFNSRY